MRSGRSRTACATNHSGVGCCVSRKSSSRARACHRTNRSNSQRGRRRAGGKARSPGPYRRCRTRRRSDLDRGGSCSPVASNEQDAASKNHCDEDDPATDTGIAPLKRVFGLGLHCHYWRYRSGDQNRSTATNARAIVCPRRYGSRDQNRSSATEPRAIVWPQGRATTRRSGCAPLVCKSDRSGKRHNGDENDDERADSHAGSALHGLE